jgi:hypothetical protein
MSQRLRRTTAASIALHSSPAASKSCRTSRHARSGILSAIFRMNSTASLVQRSTADGLPRKLRIDWKVRHGHDVTAVRGRKFHRRGELVSTSRIYSRAPERSLVLGSIVECTASLVISSAWPAVKPTRPASAASPTRSLVGIGRRGWSRHRRSGDASDKS